MSDDDKQHQDQNANPADEKRDEQRGRDEAVNVLRHKIDSLYAEEPDAKVELKESQNAEVRSKHQQFILDLQNSGKSQADIQKEWHNYYARLSDKEKHEVWDEFHAEQKIQNLMEEEPVPQANSNPEPQETEKPEVKIHPPQSPHMTKHPILKKQLSGHSPRKSPAPAPARSSVQEVKSQLTNKIHSRTKKQSHSHFRSLFFGLSMGTITVFILLFGLFNERIIAPFITPSRTVSDTPIIADSSTASNRGSRIIIPKINVDIPVVFDQPSIEEDAIQKSLEDGVVHYATTPEPGEIGNGVIFGHSSNNLLNPGKYKFAFVLLNRLQAGDTFMIEHDGDRYVYRIYDSEVVAPTNLGVLNKAERPSTFSLITCDPPGTIQNRLVVKGEQISPDPSLNIASERSESVASEQLEEIPSAPPSLWQRFIGWIQN